MGRGSSGFSLSIAYGCGRGRRRITQGRRNPREVGFCINSSDEAGGWAGFAQYKVTEIAPIEQLSDTLATRHEVVNSPET